MGFWLFEFLVSLIIVEIIWSLPLGCPYNGTSYGEGETVTTEEPCLSCVCQRGALQCNLRVCADHPNVLPPGCFFLHKPNDCCPQLFCEEENVNPVQFELQTGFKLENRANDNDCSINGSIYAEGSTVASSQACEYCYCSGGERKCIKPRCLRSFEGCKATYEKSSCCPTHYDCRTADSRRLKAQIENFVLARTDSIDSNESSGTLADLEPKSEKMFVSDMEVLEKEAGTTTIMETVTEGTTMKAENEGTTIFTEDYLTATSSGFQKELSTEDVTEESTLMVETTTEFSWVAEEESEEKWNGRTRNKSNFSETVESSAASDEESRNNSFEEGEEYDSYDYSEPQLPPSLPNLVIFPFVAADAVIKDETAEMVGIRNSKIEIKRIDVHPIFYKDYFSPPAKTEGGFMPKEPLKSNDGFYKQSYYGTKDIEASDKEPKKGAHWTNATSIDTKITDVTGTSFLNEALVDIRLPPDDLLSAASPVQKSQQAKKPVTVTYKNVVVDFYPKYLITTTRAHPKLHLMENPFSQNRPIVLESFDRPQEQITHSNAFPVNNMREPSSSDDANVSSLAKKTRESTTKAPVKSSSVSGFSKSFSPEQTTTTFISAKHKYSSKIKGQGNISPAKAVRGEVTQKAESEIENGVASTDSNSFLNIRTGPTDSTTSNSNPGKSKIYSSSRKQIKKGFTELPPSSAQETSVPGEIINGQIEFFQFLTEETPSTTNVRRETNAPLEKLQEDDSGESCVGTLLKLAGCNIYGMMYRVGKVIMELSGPCTECLCTDIGVQCRSLQC